MNDDDFDKERGTDYRGHLKHKSDSLLLFFKERKEESVYVCVSRKS